MKRCSTRHPHRRDEKRRHIRKPRGRTAQRYIRKPYGRDTQRRNIRSPHDRDTQHGSIRSAYSRNVHDAQRRSPPRRNTDFRRTNRYRYTDSPGRDEKQPAASGAGTQTEKRPPQTAGYTGYFKAAGGGR